MAKAMSNKELKERFRKRYEDSLKYMMELKAKGKDGQAWLVYGELLGTIFFAGDLEIIDRRQENELCDRMRTAYFGPAKEEAADETN